MYFRYFCVIFVLESENKNNMNALVITPKEAQRALDAEGGQGMGDGKFKPIIMTYDDVNQTATPLETPKKEEPEEEVVEETISEEEMTQVEEVAADGESVSDNEDETVADKTDDPSEEEE